MRGSATSPCFLVQALVPIAFLIATLSAAAAPPAALVAALEHLRDQKSYSWEIINSDPGPVAQELQTRRGKVTAVRQSTAPHVKGMIDRAGNMLVHREWPDGLTLDTIVMADGTTITRTPEGWMTEREILTQLSEERLKDAGVTPRLVWLRRSDRPDLRRPDQELVPLLKTVAEFDVAGDTYTARGRSGGEDSSLPVFNVTIAMNLRGGVIRDYEVKIEGLSRASRFNSPVTLSEQRIVVLTYVPVTRIDIPPEAHEKLRAGKSPVSR